MAKESTSVRVKVGDRQLKLTNVEKVLYPETGFTKGEVIDYYTRIAPVLLPHLAARPLTVKRYPNGVEGHHFFEKNAPSHTPDWVRTVTLPVPGSTMDRETIDFVVVQDLPTLVWLANLAALELHTPQWAIGPRGGAHGADLLVFDLDPGPPATIEQCCEVAVLLREALAVGGLTAYPKTSGSKGMQLSIPIEEAPGGATSSYAKRVADRLAAEHPRLIVSAMAKKLRPGKVFIDWSKNNAAKTTVSVYSLRARATPTASAPLTWEEVERGGRPSFTAPDVLDRVDDLGDLHAATLTDRAPLPS